MANQFDPFTKEENPLSIIDSEPPADETFVSARHPTDLLDDYHEDVKLDDDDTQNEDETEEEGSDDDDAEREGEEDYPDDCLDTEGWNRHDSSDEEEDEVQNPTDRDELTESEVQLQGEYGVATGRPNRNQNNSRRGLFSWGRRQQQPYSDNPDNYSAVPPDGIDEAAVQDLEVDEETAEEQEMDNELRPGDHIYVWQTYGINPRAYQRHAVVTSVRATDGEYSRSLDGTHEELSYNIDHLYQDHDEIEVTVVSFYHFKRTTGNRGRRTGCKTQHLKEFIGADGIKKKKPVHKVRYGAKVKRGILNQKVIGTALKKDAVGLILSRVQYLLDNPTHLPDHNALSANGECAAMWCVTGRWCTLQGASILQITCVGQAGGALVAGGILSNLTVLVPMPGLWGMAGWWWYVPATVAYPFLVPMLVALGMCSLVPLEILRRNRKKWRSITDGLNHEFWSNASDEIKEEYFGQMATAEREAEMRSFFGVREGEDGADDAKYMPLGGTPGGIDSDDDEEEDEALALQNMERKCKGMAADMNVNLSGKPPSQRAVKGWGSLIGSSFRQKNASNTSDGVSEEEHKSIIS